MFFLVETYEWINNSCLERTNFQMFLPLLTKALTIIKSELGMNLS